MSQKTYLILGGNVGDSMEYLRCGIELLGSMAGKIISVSSVYESEPWGFEHPQWFLNQAVELETSLTPLMLLEKIKTIEKQLGRQRTNNGYQARTVDIDILLYDNIIINTPELVIPHPRMCERMFVLLPLAEIAPNLEHPTLHLTITCLKDSCKDKKRVKVLKI